MLDGVGAKNKVDVHRGRLRRALGNMATDHVLFTAYLQARSMPIAANNHAVISQCSHQSSYSTLFPTNMHSAVNAANIPLPLQATLIGLVVSGTLYMFSHDAGQAVVHGCLRLVTSTYAWRVCNTATADALSASTAPHVVIFLVPLLPWQFL